MMDSFRKFGETKASKILLSVLVACFALWGIGGYLTATLGAAAVTVNGEGISLSTLEQTYKQRVANVSQLLGTTPTQEQMDQMQLPEQVLTEVVARTVLRQQAEKLGFVASTQQLQDEISMVSAFKNTEGKFDVARYKQILAQVGRSPAQFEHDLGQDIKVRQMALLAKVELPDAKISKVAAADENSVLTLDVATFAPGAVGAIADPSQADLEKFYKDNTEVYSKPENRDLVVLRASREDMIKSIEVPEKDVRAAYDANQKAYALPEMRKVRHILVDTKDEAEKLAKEIHSMADFEKVAKDSSKDTGSAVNGGSLGNIQEKDVVPAFGKVAFKIAENTLSEPVQSNFGWHLIWVEKIEPAKSLDFAEVKDAIARDLQASQADEALERVVNLIDTKVAAGEPLSKIATETGLKPLQYNMVTAKDENVEPQELQAGFNVQEGAVSVPITMKDGGVAYVQAMKVAPARVLPLDEVKPRAIADWKNAKAQTIIRMNADKLLAAAQAKGASGDFAALAAKAGIPGVSFQKLEVKRADEAPNWMQRNLLEIYPLAKGGVLPGALPDNGSLHLLRMADRVTAAPADSELPTTTRIYQQRLQADVEALLMGYLTENATVKLSQDHLKQLFGREVTWSVTEAR